MTLYFEEEGGLELSLPCEELANKVAEAALDYVECPYEATVNLLLTMSDEIREMNKNFRNIDAATDVLSFPMVDYETSGDFSFQLQLFSSTEMAPIKKQWHTAHCDF